LTEPEIQGIFSRLTQITSAGVIQRYGFDDFLAIAREVRERVSDDVWLEVGWEILEGIGLEEFYGCDYDILTALEHIPPESALVDIQTFLRHSLVETLLEQLDSGGTTALLNIAKMVDTPAAVLIPRIIKLRKNEIEKTVVSINGRELILYNVYMEEVDRTTLPEQSVHLEPLWLTAYGYQTLSALNFGLQTDLKGLERIKQTMTKLGVVFITKRNAPNIKIPQTKMSEALISIIMRKASGNSNNLKRVR